LNINTKLHTPNGFLRILVSTATILAASATTAGREPPSPSAIGQDAVFPQEQREVLITTNLVTFTENNREADAPLTAEYLSVSEGDDTALFSWSLEPEDEFFTFSTGTDNALLVWKPEGAPDFETLPANAFADVPGDPAQKSRTITARVCDDHQPVPNCATQIVTIRIRGIDEPPSFNPPRTGYQIRIPENIAPDTILRPAITATDQENERLVYSLSPADAPFAIDLVSGQLRISLGEGETFNFETRGVYDLTVTATESRNDTPGEEELSASIDVRIIVENVDNIAPSILPEQQFLVNTGAENGTVVGTIRFEDPDSRNFTFAIVQNMGNRQDVPFDIDGFGVLRVSLPADTLLPSLPAAYEFDVTSTDQGGNTSTQITVRVTVNSGSTASERRNEIEALSQLQAVGTARLLLGGLHSRLFTGRNRALDTFEDEPTADETGPLPGREITTPAPVPIGQALPRGTRNTPDLILVYQGQGPYGEPEKGGFGSRGSLSVWFHGSQDEIEGSAGVDHATLDYTGDFEGLTMGLEQQLNESLAVGISATIAESAFDYTVIPLNDARIESTGSYEEDSILVALYGIVRARDNLSLWGLASGGVGEGTDSRKILTNIQDATADTITAIAALGADLRLSFGTGRIQLNIDLQASVHNIYKSTEEMDYSGTAVNLSSDQTDVYMLNARAGITTGLYLDLGRIGRLNPHVSINTVHDLADYYLDDTNALDGSIGFAWQLGRLQVLAESYFELGRDDQDYTGLNTEIRFLAKRGERGLSLGMTGRRGSQPRQDPDLLALGQPSSRQLPEPWAFGLHGGYGFPIRGGLLTPYLRSEPNSLHRRYAAGLQFLSRTSWEFDLGWTQTGARDTATRNAVLLKITRKP